MKILDAHILDAISVDATDEYSLIHGIWVTTFTDTLIVVQVETACKRAQLLSSSSGSVSLHREDDTSKWARLSFRLPEDFGLQCVDSQRYWLDLIFSRESDRLEEPVILWSKPGEKL